MICVFSKDPITGLIDLLVYYEVPAKVKERKLNRDSIVILFIPKIINKRFIIFLNTITIKKNLINV